MTTHQKGTQSQRQAGHKQRSGSKDLYIVVKLMLMASAAVQSTLLV